MTNPKQTRRSTARLNAPWKVIQTLDWAAARNVKRKPKVGIYLCRISSDLVVDTSFTRVPFYVGLSQGHPADSAEPYDILVYTPAELEAFLRGVNDGDFDDLG